MFMLIIWAEGNEMKILALVSLDLDKRAKSSEGLKIRDKSMIIVITDRSLAKNKIKRKGYRMNVRYQGQTNEYVR